MRWGQNLDQVQINSPLIGFDYEPLFPLSGGTTTFTAGGGPTGELDLYKPAAGRTSSPLFPTDQFRTDIEMGSNYYLALSFQLGVTAGCSAAAGAFTLTPSSSATGCGKLYLPFGQGCQWHGLLGDSGKLDSGWLSAHVPSSVASDVQTAYEPAVETKPSVSNVDEEICWSGDNIEITRHGHRMKLIVS